MTERRVWSEDELDAALAGLHPESSPDPVNLAAARSQLLVAAGEPAVPAPAPRRPARRWLVAAAVVAALAGGALVVPWGGSAPTADARSVLAAAARGTDGDRPLRPGEFRYVRTRRWDAASAERDGKTYTYLEETLSEVWIPANEADEWVWRSRLTGNRQWTFGVTEAEYRAAGLPIDEPGKAEERRGRGGFPVRELGGPGPKEGWHNPTQAWQDGLPKDARGIYDSLRAGKDDQEAMSNALLALRSGRLRTEVRGLVYEALRLVPGIRVTDGAVDLGGRHGVALGLDGDLLGEEAIIDPVTGRFLGERTVNRRANDYYPMGAVVEHSTVTTAIAGQAGIAPTW